MTAGALLLFVLVVIVVGLLAYWIIIKFLPAEWRTISLAIVGVLLLLALLLMFLPGSLGTKVW